MLGILFSSGMGVYGLRVEGREKKARMVLPK